MKEKKSAELLGVRRSIRVLDATLRDGGLVNNFNFSEDFIRAVYHCNLRAGVDYMEMGYKASKEMNDVNKFGPLKFCDDDYIVKVIGENRDSDLKLAVMADVGRCDYKNDIKPASESPIDVIRVATYVHQMPGAIEMIEDAKNKGYEVTCNLMAVSTAREEDIKVALQMLGESPVDVIYLVDSFGALYPEQVARFADLYLEYGDNYNKKIGMHAHNNQQLAFANTIEACGDGIDWLDATYAGMGRGAGNCPMENLLGFLRNPKYSVYPILGFLEKYMTPLHQQYKWGADVPYLITGILNQHPRPAIAFSGQDRTDYLEFYDELMQHD